MGTLGTSRSAIYKDVRERFGLVPQWVSEVPDEALPGFWHLMSEFYLAETKIPNKYKDLMGLAVAGATRCRYCALFHTEAAKLHGATDDEIREASLVGGVSTMSSTFINAQQLDYDKFAKETAKIIQFAKARQKAGKPAHAK